MEKEKYQLIAGPCSAESEEQVIQTALKLKDLGTVNYYRAGIWKPRTNPGGFEGPGVKGLSWLLQAKKESGLKTATEVATAKHVEDALNFEVDLLWIGARTTVNPFSVQQLADALRGTDATVYIKNPVNPDLKLWIGALERILKAGITRVGLIHRGFSQYGNSRFRNEPLWQIPIEMKRLFPEIPLICDPSHIVGKRDGLFDVLQTSLDLDYNGAIIESHLHPEVALTDKDQQVTPVDLQAGLDQLVWKKNTSDIPQYGKELDKLRKQINVHDEQMIHLIRNRMNIAEEIGRLKQENQVTVLQNNRWNEVLDKAVQLGTSMDLSEDFIQHLMELMHLESIRLQNTLQKVEH